MTTGPGAAPVTDPADPAADPAAAGGAPVLPPATRAEVRRAAVALVRGDGWGLAGVVGLAVLATGAGLAGPWLLGRIVDAVVRGAGTARVDRLAALIAGFAALEFALTRWGRLVAARFGERIAARIREQVMDRVLALPARVVDRVSAGDLAARATGDVAAVSAAVRDAAPDVLVAAVRTVLVLGAVAVVSPLPGLAGVLTLAGVPVVTRWYLRRARAAYLAVGASTSDLAEVLATTAAGARTVEVLRLQDRRLAASRDAVAAARAARLAALRLRSVLFPAVDVSAVLPLAAVLLLGGVLVGRGTLSLGAVAAAALYLRQLDGPVETFELWVDQLQSSAASFARLEALAGPAAAAPTAASATGAPDTAPAHGAPVEAVPVDGAPVHDAPAAAGGGVDDRVRLSGVHFSYDGRRDVLVDVDLELRPGERLAVVGRSGAGKSTLARLVAGLEAPRTGSVTVGGVPAAGPPTAAARRAVALVTQQHHVFRATLRDNLALARPDADDTALRAALAAVDAGWADTLPDGLDTELGEDLLRLDPGRAQQLSLARVVLADPHTVVLDEATAMLDPGSARRTERALSTVLSGRTVLAVAHRLHTAHDADRVAVMDAGRVVELGTHDELVARGGSYAALWAVWHGGPGAG